MKVLVVLFFIFLVVSEGRRKSAKGGRRNKNLPQPSVNKQEGMRKIGRKITWCVTNQWEKMKCDRMATELTYSITPRMHWKCVLRETKDICMMMLHTGKADIITAEGMDIYMAGKYHALQPIMYEYSALGRLKGVYHHIVAIVKKGSNDVTDWSHLKGKRTCHYGMDRLHSFQAPVCSLVHKKLLPPLGDILESASNFFEKSCLPGALQNRFNPKKTNPENLCGLCQGEKRCHLNPDHEPYYGFDGVFKCLEEGTAHVGFFHSYDVISDKGDFAGYELVCRNDRKRITWNNMKNPDCSLATVQPPVIMVPENRPEEWKKEVIAALESAGDKFNGKYENALNIFSSKEYMNSEHMNGINLIFKDITTSLRPLTANNSYDKYLGADDVAMWQTCEKLRPRPRAIFCAVSEAEMSKCQQMKKYFSSIPETNGISWGCVREYSHLACSSLIDEGGADWLILNATDLAVSGEHLNIDPFMSESYDGDRPDSTARSLTIGVVRADSVPQVNTLPLRHWKLCSPGIWDASGFLHPIGWLLSNGTIPRKKTIFESIKHFFSDMCVPGMKSFDFAHDHILLEGYDYQYEYLKTDVDFTPWFKQPDWKRLTPEDMHKIMSDPKKMSALLQRCAQMVEVIKPGTEFWRNLPEWLSDTMHKDKEEFDWSNYSFDDFFGYNPEWRYFKFQKNRWRPGLWASFGVWAEHQWDHVIQWDMYKLWSKKDWEQFKSWIDNSYKMSQVVPLWKSMSKALFIRCMLYCSKYQLLEDTWFSLQGKSPIIQARREYMCSLCSGPGDEKCSPTVKEPFYNHIGALRCMASKAGDVAFIDGFKLKDHLQTLGLKTDDVSLVCPDGKIIPYTGYNSIKVCNFGKVPANTLVTSRKHDGVWRWLVTKALVSAQEKFGRKSSEFKLFGDGIIFSDGCTSLSPVNLIEQNYQTWLGPMFLRSMEAASSYWRDQDDFHWIPDAKKPGLKTTRSYLPGKDKSMMNKERRTMNTGKPDRTGDQRLLTWWHHEDVSKIFNEMYHGYQRSWTEDRPKRVIGNKSSKRRRRVPRDDGMKSDMSGEEQESNERRVMNDMMRERSRVPPARAEVYSNVIYQRKGTCNALIKHVTCFGEPRWVHVHMGRFGAKKMKDVRMCSTPSKFVKVTAEFMCNTGAGYLAPVLIPTSCEYQPCDVTYFVPGWSLNDSWDQDSAKVGSKDFWGNQAWWKTENHAMNSNWFSEQSQDGDSPDERVIRWHGENWEKQICY